MKLVPVVLGISVGLASLVGFRSGHVSSLEPAKSRTPRGASAAAAESACLALQNGFIAVSRKVSLVGAFAAETCSWRSTASDHHHPRRSRHRARR
jgi:hypothetical protein